MKKLRMLVTDEDRALLVKELALLAVGSALGVLLVTAVVLSLVRVRRPPPSPSHCKKTAPILDTTPSPNLDDERNPDVVPEKGSF